MFPLQISSMPLGPQQARQVPMQSASMQSATLPGAVAATQTEGLDITTLINLMVTMMIIVMMMKMMSGAFAST